VKKLSLFDVKT